MVNGYPIEEYRLLHPAEYDAPITYTNELEGFLACRELQIPYLDYVQLPGIGLWADEDGLSKAKILAAYRLAKRLEQVEGDIRVENARRISRKRK